MEASPTPDALIFIGFLIANVFVGRLFSRDTKTIKEYSLGDRKFSTIALVSTIVATFTTGSGFFVTLSNTYSDGLLYLIPSLCMALGFVLTGFFLVPRMSEFMGCLSVAEVMGNLYGKHVRVITAISAILWTVGGIAVQFKVFGSLFDYFLGIPSTYAIILAAITVILYSALGGIKAVTYTDVVQFLTFGFVIPAIGIIAWNHFREADLTLVKATTTPLFDYHKIMNLSGDQLLDFILLILYFTLPEIGPVHFQRISMGRNIIQVQRAWLIAAFILILIELAIAWVPFLLLSIDPSLDPSQITGYIIENFSDFGVIKGLLIVGVSAMVMSSADSFINSSAVLFGYDVKEVLNLKIDNLLLSKIFSFVLGIFAIFLALSTNDLLSMVMSTASFYIPIVTPPLIFAILGFRTTTKSVLIAMASGFATVIVWKFLDTKLNCIIFALAINIIFLFGSHYLLNQPGGWVGIKDTRYLDRAKKRRKIFLSKFVEAVVEFEIVKFLKDKAPKNELTYMWMGIYFIIFTFTTMYATQVELLKENGNIVLTVYQIMMITGVITAMYPIWPKMIKSEIVAQISWTVVIFYMLIFCTCFFVMVSDFGQLQFGVFVLNILIATILLGWKFGAIMTVFGFYLSIKFYKYYKGLDAIDFSLGSPQFMFMYALILIGTVVVVFFRPKQEYQELTEQKNGDLNDMIDIQEDVLKQSMDLQSEFLRNISHEYNAPMTGVLSMAEVLRDSYDKIPEETRKQAIEDIFISSARLDCFDSNIRILASLAQSKLKLQKADFNLSEMVQERIERCQKLYDKNADNHEIIVDIADDIKYYGDQKYLSKAVDNLIINALQYCTEGKIEIELKESAGKIVLCVSDDGLGIPEYELHSIFDKFKVSSKTSTPAGGRGIGLTVSQNIVELHDGKIWAQSDGKKGASFFIELYTK